MATSTRSRTHVASENSRKTLFVRQRQFTKVFSGMAGGGRGLLVLFQTRYAATKVRIPRMLLKTGRNFQFCINKSIPEASASGEEPRRCHSLGV